MISLVFNPVDAAKVRAFCKIPNKLRCEDPSSAPPPLKSEKPITPIIKPMTASTTRSSIKVKPDLLVVIDKIYVFLFYNCLVRQQISICSCTIIGSTCVNVDRVIVFANKCSSFGLIFTRRCTCASFKNC